jgi:predicted dithiol-disulfide oxidoreductase (DUF899 family)
VSKVVGTRAEWLAARTALLAEEKELTRRSDELARKNSAAGSNFNLDFGVFTEDERRTGSGFNFGTPKHAEEVDLRRDELHGLSAFALEDGVVYHAYSCYDRGTDVLSATWQLLDRTPKGRGNDPEGWPRRHDEYD